MVYVIILISQSLSIKVKNLNFKTTKCFKKRNYEFIKNRYWGIEMGELSELPNIGKVLEKQLNDTGINTPDELINIGSKEAWLKIRAEDDSACLNRLMALEGAIQNIRWHDLSENDKKNLRDFYNSQKRI